MTRLAIDATTTKTKQPNVAELLHDLTEIVGELVCGCLPFDPRPGAGRSCDSGSCGCGSGGCGCGSTCPSCGGAGKSCSCGSLPGCDIGGIVSSLGSLPCLQLCEDEPCWPCWLPNRLAPIDVLLAPGATLRVRFDLQNDSLAQRAFFVAATGTDAAAATGAPSSVDVGPMDHGRLTAIVRMPTDAAEHQTLDLLLWVRGAFDHVVPVIARVAETGGDVVLGRSITEQPDTCHTWHDHFYVSRRGKHGRG